MGVIKTNTSLPWETIIFKGRVYVKNQRTILELKSNIRCEIKAITFQLLQKLMEIQLKNVLEKKKIAKQKMATICDK